jgi:hypothetical protein
MKNKKIKNLIVKLKKIANPPVKQVIGKGKDFIENVFINSETKYMSSLLSFKTFFLEIFIEEENIEVILKKTIPLMLNLLKIDQCTILKIKNQKSFDLIYVYPSKNSEKKVSELHKYIMKDLSRDTPVIYSDTNNLPGNILPLANQMKLETIGVFPINFKNFVWGSIILEQKTKTEEWEPLSISLIIDFTKYLGITLERNSLK